MLSGRVEHYSADGVSGWALDTDRPQDPEFVDVMIDGQLYARLRCGLYRVGTRQAACGFKLVFPPEFRFGRRRALVDVRFTRTQERLANTPRAIGFVGGAKRVLVLCPAGTRYNHDDIKARPEPLRDHIAKYYNTGDWMVYDSSLKLLSFNEITPMNIFDANDKEIDRFNEEYDYAFLRGSNYIHNSMDWRTADQALAKLKIPVLAFSVGAQAPNREKLELSSKQVSVWKAFADHAATIGVRGAYTAEVLNAVGIKNVEIIGCPSLFRHNNPCLQIRPKPIDQLHRVAFNLRREVSRDYASDIDIYLAAQKKAIKALAHDYDLTLTAHGEPEEKSYYYKDNDLIEKYRTQLFKSGWFESENDEMISIYENKLFYNDKVADFDSFIRTQDLALGFRVHGNLPALANGVPAIVVDYDSRSSELAQTFRIPLLTLTDLGGRTLSDIYKPELWDGFNRAYADGYRRMAAFLTKNGIAHNMAAV